MGRTRVSALLPTLALAALATALVLSVAGVPYLPTHDGPQHVFTAHAANHLHLAGTGWSRWLEANVPVTSHGFTAVFSPFDLWLPWQTALRLALAVMVLVWAIAAYALARAVHPGRAWLGVALAAAACQWSLYMGFFSFHVATGFGLIVLAAALRSDPWTPRARCAIAALLLAQSLLHVVAAMTTGAAVAGLALARAPAGGRLRALAGASAMGLPAALPAVALVAVGLDTLGSYNSESGDPVQLSSVPLASLARFFASGPAWRAWPLLALAIAGLLCAVPPRLRPRRPTDRAFVGAGALLLAAAAWLPLHLRAWDFFSVRFLPLGVALCLLSLPFERLRPGLQRAGAALVVLWAGAATAWAFDYHRALYAAAEPGLAGLEAPLLRRDMRLPVVLDPYRGSRPDQVPHATPHLNLGQLYAATQGGLVPYTFMFNPNLHSVLLREERKHTTPAAVDRRYAIDLSGPEHRDTPAFRRAVIAHVAGRATAYEDVIFWGREEDADLLLSLGFSADFRADGLALARFVGCPLTVRFPAGAAPARDATLAVGWYPAWSVTHRYPLAKARRSAGGDLELHVRQSCDSVWLGFENAPVGCEGADAEGRLRVASTRRTPEVVCRVTPLDLALNPPR